MAITEQELGRAYMEKANAIGLQVDCLFHGDPNSEIVIIAEAPGEREKSLGIPLVGGAGHKLWTVLQTCGIKRDQCFVTNVSKRQISQSAHANVRSPMKGIEEQHWANLLRWELSHLTNAKIIICLGGMALRALFGHSSITAWRGSVLHYNGIPTILTYNPAMVLRELKWDPVFQLDINKINYILAGKFDFYADKKFKYRFDLSPAEVEQEITRLIDEKKPIAFDIETIANETACIGFSNGDKYAVTINFRDATKSIYTLEEEVRIRRRIQDLFSAPDLRFIAQNGNFDSSWLWYKDRLRVPRIWFDTMTAHHTLYPRLPHNLGFLTTQYTQYPYYKEEKTIWREGGDISSFWQYNGKDCIITGEICTAMLQELKSQGLDRFYFEHVARLAPELVTMTVCGVRVDTSLKQKLRDDLASDVRQYETRFVELARRATGDPNLMVNYNSPVQLSDLFFNKLKLVGRGYATDEENRERMKNHHATTPVARDMIEALNTLKSQGKFLSTYAEIEIDEDSRARCEYKQIGTQAAPGRLSSGKVWWGTGANLQNQPQRAQQMYVADENETLVYNDLSQAEARVVAEIWNVRQLLDNFEKAKKDNSFDIHRLNASSIFQVPYDSVPSYDRLEYGKHTQDKLEDGKPTRRFLGKRCVHGLNYRMQAPKLADVCGIDLPQATDAYNNYHHAFPEIKVGWADTIARVKKDKMLWTPMGRRLIFLEPILNDDQLDSIIAFVPQSTIGDKVAEVIYLCHNDPEWPRRRNGQLVARMLLNIHDALISQTPISEIKTVMAITKKHSERAMLINGRELSIPSEFKIAIPDEHGMKRWSTLTKPAKAFEYFGI